MKWQLHAKIIFFLLIILCHQYASSQIVIISDGSWKASTVYDPNWTDVNFDDSGWGNSVSPAPNGITPVVPGSQSMWINGTPANLYFRKKFTLNDPVTNAPAAGTADNEFHLYVNGIYIGMGNNWANIYNFDIESELNCGENVIAIQGVEWIVGTPSLVSFKTTIDTVASTLAVNLGNDTSFCGSLSLTLDAQNPGLNFMWQDSSTNQIFTVTNSGTYSVTVSDTNFCSASDTITIIDFPAPSINIGTDTIFCGSFLSHLDAGTNFSSYQWQDSSSSQSFIADSAGTYFVTATDINGCVASDTITITNSNPAIELGNDTAVCKSVKLLLDAGETFASYLWNDGSTGSQLIVSAPGFYSVSAIDSFGCPATDDITIDTIAAVISFLMNDTTVCEATTLSVDAWSGYENYTWLNNDGMVVSSQQNYVINTPGTYSVIAEDADGCLMLGSMKLSIKDCEVFVMPSAFTPNGDGVNDEFGIIETGHHQLNSFKIFDRWGNLMFETNNITTAWNGTYEGKPAGLDAYIYMVDAIDETGKRFLLKGNVTLIR